MLCLLALGLTNLSCLIHHKAHEGHEETKNSSSCPSSTSGSSSLPLIPTRRDCKRVFQCGSTKPCRVTAPKRDRRSHTAGMHPLTLHPQAANSRRPRRLQGLTQPRRQSRLGALRRHKNSPGVHQRLNLGCQRRKPPAWSEVGAERPSEFALLDAF